ncbi:Phage shock protein PspC (stress-responsive transcriptional regulator) [Nakamurella panacisegetis]|uniref:Phage shock protein PspC (Stress-responsive transcriptional regulator) n=1 Tax=Nakamurella panacisegetis TaxID=1090615 RepID=A0A1H0IZQ1_9ACTN|nr:PspC domain-containing protein [Nakamurella panacisegetis]SDO36925.1 Phage shock protein PspC (stress-responsive transcriptional regulator) [Nakamurella panacisegetis]
MSTWDDRPPSVAEPPSGPNPPVRRLYRSREDRVIAGVCGGLARYLGVDPVVIRIAAVAISLGGGGGVLLYIIGWIGIPEAPGQEPIVVRRPGQRGAAIVAGAILLGIGGLMLLHQLVPWFNAVVFWPFAVALAGVVLIVSALQRPRPR